MISSDQDHQVIMENVLEKSIESMEQILCDLKNALELSKESRRRRRNIERIPTPEIFEIDSEVVHPATYINANTNGFSDDDENYDPEYLKAIEDSLKAFTPFKSEVPTFPEPSPLRNGKYLMVLEDMNPDCVKLIVKLRFAINKILKTPLKITSLNPTSIKLLGNNEENLMNSAIHIKTYSLGELAMIADGQRKEEIYIYIDNSNIFLGSQNILNETTKKLERDQRIRLNAFKLHSIVSGFRDVNKRYIVGSSPATVPKFWDKWNSMKYTIQNISRNNNGREQGVDDILMSAMLKQINGQHGEGKRTIVLLTGDGNLNNGRLKFTDVVEEALRRGWKVEVWSWENSTHNSYKQYAQSYQGDPRFTLNYLDLYRPWITFLDRSREMRNENDPLSNVTEEDVSCSISCCLFRDPVKTNCNHSFERAYLMDWLQANSGCPLCRSIISIDQLQDDEEKRELVRKYRERYPNEDDL